MVLRRTALTRFDPRLCAAACTLSSLKAHDQRIDPASLCTAFRRAVGPARFVYGPADVVAAELALLPRLAPLLAPPAPHALLSALLPQLPWPAAASRLAWRLNYDLHRTRVPADYADAAVAVATAASAAAATAAASTASNSAYDREDSDCGAASAAGAAAGHRGALLLAAAVLYLAGAAHGYNLAAVFKVRRRL